MEAHDQKESHSSGLGCLVRLYWMMFGNVILFLLFVFIIGKRSIYPLLLDCAFFIAGLSLIIIRYVDIRFFHGQTGEGEPATMEHFRRYALRIGAIASGAWLLARSLAGFL